MSHDTLGRITLYAAAHLGAQSRTHIYSVFILRDTARLLRWDRSGAIVTEVTKYNECDILADNSQAPSVDKDNAADKGRYLD